MRRGVRLPDEPRERRGGADRGRRDRGRGRADRPVPVPAERVPAHRHDGARGGVVVDFVDTVIGTDPTDWTCKVCGATAVVLLNREGACGEHIEQVMAEAFAPLY